MSEQSISLSTRVYSIFQCVGSCHTSLACASAGCLYQAKTKRRIARCVPFPAFINSTIKDSPASRTTTADSERVFRVLYFALPRGRYTGCCTPYSARLATIVPPFLAQPRDVSGDFVHRVRGPISFDEALPENKDTTGHAPRAMVAGSHCSTARHRRDIGDHRGNTG